MVSIVCDDENNYYRYRRYNQEMAQRGDPFGINPRLRALLEPEPPKMEEGEGRATPATRLAHSLGISPFVLRFVHFLSSGYLPPAKCKTRIVLRGSAREVLNARN